jgi:manganese/iron transport system substrate-binding protein
MTRAKTCATRPRRSGAIAAVSLAVALLGTVVAACGGQGGSPGASGGGTVQVVTTTTIFADLVRQVGGNRVSVESLVPRGGEVHTFDPKPSDVRRISKANVVFLNGLGLDDWLANLVADAGTSAPVVKLGEGLDGVDYLSGGEGGTTTSVNPHLWLNVAYAEKYVERIRSTLVTLDPAHAADYAAGAQTYTKALAAVDAQAKATLAAIPVENRTVISFHDAFPYFAAAYGLNIDGSVVSAPGQEPSAAQVSALIQVIRDKHVKAIFAEAQFSDKLVRTIADETGAKVVASLYTDSVGDAPQDTYAGMMTWNIAQVAAALGGS